MSLSLFRTVSALMRRFVRFIAVRRAVSELARLDDHTLADLGIGRHEIRGYAAGTLPRPAAERRRALIRVIEGGRARGSGRPAQAWRRFHLVPSGA